MSRLVRAVLAKFQLTESTWCRAARLYRACFPFTTFIGVTGSMGKTTTKELIGAVLSARWRGEISKRFNNGPGYVAKGLFRTAPWRRFCLNELGGPGPGRLALTLTFYRPHVGVVTAVGQDHWSAFKSLDAVAIEKRRLVEAVPPEGTAVLNADDPSVLAMRTSCRGRVVTYGVSSKADVRGSKIRAQWPDRLSFTAESGGERVPLQTRLVGEHWVSAALAAMATGTVFGIPLAESAQALARVEPSDSRMSVHPAGRDIVFIRDDWKSSPATIDSALSFLRQARCRRKVAIFGTLSDVGSRSRRYRKVCRAALEAASIVIFTGEHAGHVSGVQPPPGRRIVVFERLKDLHHHLDNILQPGDLVLLKGSHPKDHLERLAHARTDGYRCWRVDCGKMVLCSYCRLRFSDE